MRRLFFSLLFLSLLPLSVALLVWFSLEPTPQVEIADTLTHQDVARARQILAQNNPDRLKADALHILSLSEKDLSLAANYLIRNIGSGGAIIKLTPNQLKLRASIQLPENPVNPYLNLDMQITETQGKASVSKLYLGQLPVPGRLADFVLVEVMQYLLHNEDRQLIKNTIKKLSFSDGHMQIVYKWKPELIAKVKSRLISPEDQERIRSYYSKMAELTRQPGLKHRSSIMYILRPLFVYAQIRSKTGDPVAENRAALIVLAAYVMPRRFGALMPAVSDLSMPRKYVLTLDRRKDFVEHFVGSAALVVTSDVTLADAIGLYKEVVDSKGRSGFSFTDLAADRAGTRFGEIATASESHARRVQQMLADGAVEKDLIPHTRDLPENMAEKEFKQRFGKIGSSEFNKLKKQIEQRITACRLYREVG